MTARLKFIFFLSGAAGLIYEIVWARLLNGVFGSTAMSTTAVFSVFLLSLAIGAAIFGRVPVYGRKAVRLYAWIEIGVGISAVVVSAVLFYGGSWIAVYRPAPAHLGLALLSDCLLTALLIGLPTVLMGGSLPAILNSVSQSPRARDFASRLYSWNTLGAASGTLLAGFVLIWKLGLIGTVLFAVSINLIIGIYALILSNRFEEQALPRDSKLKVMTEKFSSDRWSWMGLAFLSGFAALGYEVLWGRLARFLIGDHTLSTTSLLFIFIACLGVGAWIAPLVGRYFLADCPERTLTLIAQLFLLTAVLHLLSVAACYHLIKNEGVVFAATLESQISQRILSLWLLMMLPILVLGVVFPLLVWSSKEMEVRPGRTMADLYWVNTLGASSGAIAATFAFTPNLQTSGGFLIITGLLAITSVLILLFRGKHFSRNLLAGGVLAGIILVSVWFPRSLVVLRPDERLLKANEDEYGVQVLVATQAKTLRIRNNRRQLVRDLGDHDTAFAQQMAAHWAVLVAQNCRAALNIGTGYGVTAGAITLYEDVQTLETIELLPFVIEQQAEFATYNYRYFDDPRVELVQGDGYHQLLTSSSTYDIISVNVLDPHLPGSSSLYTTDFWQTACARLNPGGVLTQLIWGKQAVPLLVEGLSRVFPTTLFFPMYNGQAYHVIAFRDTTSKGEVNLRFERIGGKAEEQLRRLMGPNWKRKLRIDLGRAWQTSETLHQQAESDNGHVHSKNHPLLEFRWGSGAASHTK